MKTKKFFISVGIILLMVSMNFSNYASAVENDNSVPSVEQNSFVVIEDINLKKAINEELNFSGANKGLEDNITKEEMLSISTLVIIEKEITSIKGLEEAKNLTSLTADFNKISDLKPLKDLKNLDTLFLNDNLVEDISPLESLENLTKLRLINNKLSTIQPLENLTNLKELRLNANKQIKDFTSLSKLENLEKLYLTNNNLSNISFLSNLEKLSEVGLANNRIFDFSPLKKSNPRRIFYDKQQLENDIVLKDKKFELPVIKNVDGSVVDYDVNSDNTLLIYEVKKMEEDGEYWFEYEPISNINGILKVGDKYILPNDLTIKNIALGWSLGRSGDYLTLRLADDYKIVDIPFEVVEIEDSTLERGNEVVVRNGEFGKKLVAIVDNKEIDYEILLKASNKIIRKGTLVNNNLETNNIYSENNIDKSATYIKKLPNTGVVNNNCYMEILSLCLLLIFSLYKIKHKKYL